LELPQLPVAKGFPPALHIAKTPENTRFSAKMPP
jgi:hypothetical protein